MQVAVDIGNQAIKTGIFRDGDLIRTFEIPSDTSRSPSAYRHTFQRKLDSLTISHAAVCSVVPSLTPVVERAMEDLTLQSPLHITTDTPTPINLAYETPETLGADRLALVVGAHVQYQQTTTERVRLLVVDAGTAVTIEVIDDTATYQGGLIAPGPTLTRDALHTGTSQLPKIPLVLPEQPIGRSTREGLQAGIMWGLIDQVRGALSRLRDRHDGKQAVIATGGWASFLAEHIEVIEAVEPHLVLEGIHYLLQDHRSSWEE